MSEAAESKQGADQPTFDARLKRLEEIVAALEQGGLELEPAIAQYKEGVHLLKSCRTVLAGYRDQVEELTREAAASLTPYDGDPDAQQPG